MSVKNQNLHLIRNRKLKFLLALGFFLVFTNCVKKNTIINENYNDFDIYKLEPLKKSKRDIIFYLNTSMIDNKIVGMDFIDLKGNVIKHDTVFYDDSNNKYVVNIQDVYKSGYPDRFKIYVISFLNKGVLNKHFLIEIGNKLHLICFDLFDKSKRKVVRKKIRFDFFNKLKFNSIDEYIKNSTKNFENYTFKNYKEIVYYYDSDDFLYYSEVVHFNEKSSASGPEFDMLSGSTGNLYLDLDLFDFERKKDSILVNKNVIFDLLQYTDYKEE